MKRHCRHYTPLSTKAALLCISLGAVATWAIQAL